MSPRTFSCSKQTLTEESQCALVKLMLRYKYLVDSKVSPSERTKNSGEMWMCVRRDFQAMGYTYTLEYLQSSWYAMKNKYSKSDCNFTRPRTQLEYLMNCYLKDVDEKTEPPPNNSLESKNSELTSKIVVIDLSNDTDEETTAGNREQSGIGESAVARSDDTVTAPENHRQNVELSSAINDCGVMSIRDEANAQSIVSAANNNVGKQETCDMKHEQNENAAISDNRKPFLSDQTESEPVKTPPRLWDATREQSKPIRRGRKKKGWLRLESWTVAQKLHLVREMRTELCRMISEQELETSKNPPWKRILEKLISNGVLNYSFQRLYYVWGRLRMSATIYEKNGQDVVDEEVWKLLQLFTDAQKGLPIKDAVKQENICKTEGIDECEESSCKPNKLQKLNESSEINTAHHPQNNHVSFEDIGRDSPAPRLRSEEKPTEKQLVDGGMRGYCKVSTRDKFEIIELIEKEFDRMLESSGRITDSINGILKNLKYKDYKSNTLIYIWSNLKREVSKNHTNLSELERKVLKLVVTYRKFKTWKKMKQNPTAKKTETVARDGNRRKKKRKRGVLSEKEKLGIISVVRSFGNEVFKKMDVLARDSFWARVASKLEWPYSVDSLTRNWGKMLRSAKLSWAQEGRAPGPADQEIIDFMKAVIREKEKTEEDVKVKPVEETESNNDEGSGISGNDEGVSRNGEGVEEGAGEESPRTAGGSDETKTEEGETSDYEDVIGDYDYVSLADIMKSCSVASPEKPQTVIDEVILISDSDEE